MASEFIAGKRGNVYYTDPANIILVTKAWMAEQGLKEHHLWHERAEWAPKEEMILAIMRWGVKVPTKVTKDKTGVYMVEGRQRLKALLEANRRLTELGQPEWPLPVMNETGNDVDQATTMVMLNQVRYQSDVVDLAEECARLLERNGNNRKDAALAFGVSTMTISNWMKIVNLHSAVKSAVRSGKLSAEAAAKNFKDVALVDQKAQLETLLAEMPVESNQNGQPKKLSTRKVAAKLGTNNGEPTRRQQAKRMLEQSTKVPEKTRIALQWALEIITTEEAAEHLSWLKEALEA